MANRGIIVGISMNELWRAIYERAAADGGPAGDALAASIAERLKEVFHGADLTDSGLHSYASSFDDFQSPVAFDEDRRAYTQALRFRFVVGCR